MRYEGPIYRPPSEADSLLVQATIGCPYNRCTFCMVYKNGTPFRVRPVQEIREDMDEGRRIYRNNVKTLFFPAGNTIAMKTPQLAEICRYGREIFPRLDRITVYGSSQYIHKKGEGGMKELAAAGLSRIHVGLESGDDVVLERIKKGATADIHIAAGQMTVSAGIELSLYVMLGIGSLERTTEHALETVRVINEVHPHFVRLRTFVPKVNTPLLEDVLQERFTMLTPHQVLEETIKIIKGIEVSTMLTSDHYTNYVNVQGHIPKDKEKMLSVLKDALKRDESTFRGFFIGTN